MAFTYSKLAEVTVGSGGAASIDFNNIPQNYNDLILNLSGRASSSGINNATYITINGSTSNFTGKYLQGNNASAISATLARYFGQLPDTAATVSTFSNLEAYFPNYASANNKSFSVNNVQENNSTTAGHALLQLVSGLWSNTTAITSIKIEPSSTTFTQHSTATLYGVKAEV